jgi:hypothetical protein
MKNYISKNKGEFPSFFGDTPSDTPKFLGRWRGIFPTKSENQRVGNPYRESDSTHVGITIFVKAKARKSAVSTCLLDRNRWSHRG